MVPPTRGCCEIKTGSWSIFNKLIAFIRKYQTVSNQGPDSEMKQMLQKARKRKKIIVSYNRMIRQSFLEQAEDVN